MPAPTTTDSFLDLVRKSNLVDPARLDAYLAKLRDDEIEPADPPRLAARMVKDGILTSFQAQQLLRGRYRNFTIVDKYKILEPLGQGGMSKVFLVEHLAMGHRVAMKILPIAGTKDDPSLIARFKREAKAVATLNHPNVVRAHDISEGDRFHYIIMDYIEGVNLHDLVRKRGPLDPADAAHFIYQTAVGLQHVHDAGLIHRDIKPGNLLVDRDGVVKILDLGLARFEADGESLTKKFDDKAILGTADYLAPEQALGSLTLDSRADIYGLGATLYYMLAGRGPFENERNVAQKLLGHQMRTPDPIAEMRSDVPPELLDVVDRMMEKKPEDRYQSAAEVAAALAPWADVDVPPPTDEELPRRSLASQGSSGQIARASRSSPGSKAPSTVRRGSASAVTESPMPSSPVKSRPPVRAGAQSKVGIKPRSTTVLIAAIAGGTLALVGLSLLVWWLLPSGSPSVTPPQQTKTSPPKVDESKTDTKPNVVPKAAPTAVAADIPADALFVTAESKPNAFPNLAAAVAAVTKDGATIIVQLPLAEHLTLGSDTAKNLTILAASPDGGLPWKAAAGADAGQPLLRIAACDGLTISGFSFEGEFKLDTLIAIDGICPGLKLNGLTLQGAKSAYVRFGGKEAAGGTSDRPARLIGCRLVTPRDVFAGIAFESQKANEFVEIEQSRIEGPFQSGILFAGPVEGVTVQQNRLYAMADGLRYAPIKSKAPLRAAIIGNTFYQMPRSIGFRELPPTDGSHVTVQNNLFIDVEQLAMVDNLTLAPADVTGQWVWLGDDPKPANPTVIPQKQPRYFRKVLDLTTLPTGPVTLDIAGDESFVAYVNGEKVSEGVPDYFNERVYSFDVTKHLRLGKNAIAVQGINQNDGLNGNFGTAAGLFANLTDRTDGSARLMASTDESWKVGKAAPEGWNLPNFDDATWAKAKPWGALQVVWPWTHVTWDAVVDKQLAAKGWKPLKLALGGNVRNYASWEGYPVLDAMRGYVDDNKKLVIPRDPADPQFLLYPPSHGLLRAGVDKKPVGVPAKNN